MKKKEQREKLIELLSEHHSGNYAEAEVIADYLIANGVVIPVRCEECAFHTAEEPGMVFCPNVVGYWAYNNDFCSRAKQKGVEGMRDENRID